MEKIASFTINHLKLSRGIFVSRRDEVGGEVVTTFDIAGTRSAAKSSQPSTYA